MRKYEIINITKSKERVILSPDNNIHHEVHMEGYDLHMGVKYPGGGSYTNCITLTMEDLKELRRVIRKVIRDEGK